MEISTTNIGNVHGEHLNSTRATLRTPMCKNLGTSIWLDFEQKPVAFAMESPHCAISDGMFRVTWHGGEIRDGPDQNNIFALETFGNRLGPLSSEND